MSRIKRPINSAAIQALIPELRVAARDLVNGSAIEPDALVQTALTTALRNWNQLPAGAALKPWLLGVLKDQVCTTGDPGSVERAQQLGALPAERD